MADPTRPLSPAAQAVLDAANGNCVWGPDDYLNDSNWIAAAAEASGGCGCMTAGPWYPPDRRRRRLLIPNVNPYFAMTTNISQTLEERGKRYKAAAALRAVADQVVPDVKAFLSPGTASQIRSGILAIAAELEGLNG